MAKEILGVDLDNVISNTDEVVREIIGQRFGIPLRREDIVDFAYSECGITKEQERELFEQFHEQACGTVIPLEGCRDALVQLQSRFEVHIITSRNPMSADITKAWLTRNEIPHDKLEFAESKSVMTHLSTLIDDRRETIYQLADAGVPGILWDYPWNQPSPQDPPIVRRVRSWEEIVELLGP
jgi:uncharacterized HAD superfamily protein